MTNNVSGSFFVLGRGFDHAGEVSGRLKKVFLAEKMSNEIIRRVAIITFEVEVNIISYADHGTIFYHVDNDVITIEAVDQGQGIKDIELAIEEGFSTADDEIRELGFGAGMGLANIKRFSDTFELSSVPGQGTSLKCTIRTDSTKMDL
ncbi:MAG: ATP-binding protein [Thermodesulfobacteriota bacterium]|nr:ATP-binding protein [Thermodesulfobacteriota bacterium]